MRIIMGHNEVRDGGQSRGITDHSRSQEQTAAKMANPLLCFTRSTQDHTLSEH
jgi:hypothetical protein